MTDFAEHALYCIVLYSTVLYGTVWYCTVLYGTVILGQNKSSVPVECVQMTYIAEHALYSIALYGTVCLDCMVGMCADDRHCGACPRGAEAEHHPDRPFGGPEGARAGCLHRQGGSGAPG